MFWESSVEHKERWVLFAAYNYCNFFFSFLRFTTQFQLSFCFLPFEECLCSTRVHVSRVLSRRASLFVDRMSLIHCHFPRVVAFEPLRIHPADFLCATLLRKHGRWDDTLFEPRPPSPLPPPTQEGDNKKCRRKRTLICTTFELQDFKQMDGNIWDVVTSSRTKTFWRRRKKKKRTLQTVLGRLEHLSNLNKSETGRLESFL